MILRPLVKYWRSNGIKAIVYLDDGWTCDTFENCQRIARVMQNDLFDAGFLVNQEKSQWGPTQILDWLGFTWNLRDGIIDIPKHKLENLREKVLNIRSKRVVTIRRLASVVGSIISLRFAYGPVCQFFTRQMSMLITQKLYWDQPIQLNVLAHAELEFLFLSIFSLPPRVISPWFREPERIIYTDASDHAGA